VKFPSAANDNLINRTIGLWQSRGRRTLSHEDARQIVENVTGFFSILHEWSRAEISRAGNHQTRIGTSLREHTAGNTDPSQERTD